jgi:hypothetical protein
MNFIMAALAIIIALSVSSASAQVPTRPETGTYIKDIDRSGDGILVVHNNWRMDTVAVLADQDVRPLIAVFIRAKDSWNITGIEDGSYNLYFTVGNYWDAENRKFDSVFGYYRCSSPLIFETSETEGSKYELDLYEAGGSNFFHDYFQFPDLR